MMLGKKSCGSLNDSCIVKVALADASLSDRKVADLSSMLDEAPSVGRTAVSQIRNAWASWLREMQAAFVQARRSIQNSSFKLSRAVDAPMRGFERRLRLWKF